MTKCIEKMKSLGQAYPRTCPTCGLGPCPHFANSDAIKGETQQKHHERVPPVSEGEA